MTRIAEKDTCCTCGFQWTHSLHGGHSCAQQLKAELEVTERLLAIANTVLHEIPECPAHGKSCVPHAIDWIRKARVTQEQSQYPPQEYRLIHICETLYGRVRDVWGLTVEEYDDYAQAIHKKAV